MEAPLEAWGAMGSGDLGGVTEQLGKHRLLIPQSSPLSLRGLGPMEGAEASPPKQGKGTGA